MALVAQCVLGEVSKLEVVALDLDRLLHFVGIPEKVPGPFAVLGHKGWALFSQGQYRWRLQLEGFVQNGCQAAGYHTFFVGRVFQVLAEK